MLIYQKAKDLSRKKTNFRVDVTDCNEKNKFGGAKEFWGKTGKLSEYLPPLRFSIEKSFGKIFF